jgi:LuxR family maltose regulon positive regulatory protein
VDDNIGREIEGILRAGQLLPGEIISATLSNDILAWEDRFLLILDDFQVIQDHFIMEVLRGLITNLFQANLPQPLHLVLLSREEPSLPLARLRANNQLSEIRAGNLRFTGPEAACFLNEVMDLSISPADIAVLEDKTEGWIVGLQLAGLSVRDRADPAGFIATLSGSHRHILSYLTEEVLSRQPQEIQGFLLQTSILDRLCGDLCNAVTKRSDSHLLLEQLLKANLFLIPLDDEQQWYRYHHLFADLLRDLQNTRPKDQTAKLHRRASRWYARAGGEDSRRLGEHGAFVGEAIRHALAAADYALAVQLLESYATEMIMQGYVKTVNGWVQTIPPEWASQSTRTNLAFAWMHLLRGIYAQASPYLERLQTAFQVGAEKNPSLKAEWLTIQTLLLNMQGKTTESLALANQALAIAPEQDRYVRSLIYMALAGAYQLREDYAHAVEAYQISIQHGRAAGNSVAEMMSIAGLALMVFEHGQLHLAFEIASPASSRVESSGSPPPISAVVYGTLGQVYYQWHQLEQARSHIMRAIQLSDLGGYNSGAIYYRLLLSRLFHLEGNLEAAVREIQQVVDLIQVEAPADIRKEVVAQQVCLYLAQNRLAAAEMALEMQGLSCQDEFSFPDLENITHSVGLLYNSRLRVLLYQVQIQGEPLGLSPGIELASCLIAQTLPRQYNLVAVETLLLRAQMHTALGNNRGSVADYAKAVELAQPEELISIFVEHGTPVLEALTNLVKQDQLETVQSDHVERILAAFSYKANSDRQPVPTPPAGAGRVTLIESLTDRELDVLCLMAEGLKYEEIATRLFISLNTVRSHVKAIYGKLNVNNRTKAIETARQLQIL